MANSSIAKSAVFILLGVLGFVSNSDAAIVTTFDLSGSLTGQSSLTFRNDNLMENGVTFDAVLTVTGFSAGGGGSAAAGTTGSTISINNNGSGIGVGTSAPINENQSLQFSVDVENVTGGTAQFDGFQVLTLSAFNLDDGAVLFDSSGGNQIASLSDASGDTDTLTFASFTGDSFILFGEADADRDASGTISSTSFRAETLSASFSTAAATAVPEPSSVCLLGAICGVGLVAGYRRKNRAQLVADATARH